MKKTNLDRSRLGRLLVNRGYITESQLLDALQEQAQSNVRLGEILIAKGLLSERDLQRTLKHQSRYRFAAAMVAMTVAPLQPMVAMAATATQAAIPVPKTHLQPFKKGGLIPLEDAQMASVSAQGMSESIATLLTDLDRQSVQDQANAKIAGEKENAQPDQGLDGIEVLGEVGKLVLPMVNVLDADIEIEGVHIDPSRMKPLLTGDGGFNVILPNRIDRVSFRDIRPKGQIHGPTMGTIHLEGIRFSDEASIVIRPL